MRQMWTYSDGAGTVKGYWRPGGAAWAGSWVLVGQASGTVQGIVRAGEFSRRFRPVDVFADVPALPGYLGTVTAADGTALVDLVLDRNPFILANGPRRAARRSSGAHSPVPQPTSRTVSPGRRGSDATSSSCHSGEGAGAPVIVTGLAPVGLAAPATLPGLPGVSRRWSCGASPGCRHRWSFEGGGEGEGADGALRGWSHGTVSQLPRRRGR